MDILEQFLPTAIIDHVLLGYLDNKDFFSACQKKDKYVKEFIERTQKIFLRNFKSFLADPFWNQTKFECFVYGVRLPHSAARFKRRVEKQMINKFYPVIAEKFFMNPSHEMVKRPVQYWSNGPPTPGREIEMYYNIGENMIYAGKRTETPEDTAKIKGEYEVSLLTLIFSKTEFYLRVTSGEEKYFNGSYRRGHNTVF